ncbi:succinylglutamate desuccinylase [Pigmentiphaga aceris]|uniref:Succinylglutamate desuccinylase n=1 Tax=Pigmentiphaga aceris TaxID=1940612 RepID=A0A5C0B096_9BURK|nr:succinylglutamate desuccinylase/aspartoacylase family protein [Pigmentiphaga aceris]QEI08018.1 succinylglutamate desuccinylase [Pigmentiphaga aceris]
MSASPSATLRPFALAYSDISTERVGNTDTEGVWHFDSGKPGRKVLLTALIHGNEICGAWALKHLLAAGIRPRTGSLTLAFCNLAAFDRFDANDNLSSRFVEEDMNRVWSEDKLASGSTIERRRAAQLVPWVKQADWLLDFHSMSASDDPLQLSGLQQRNIDLALELGNPTYTISDAGHAAGVRMRDYGRFGEAGDNGTRSLLIECGFHGAIEAESVALDNMARFLVASGIVERDDLPANWFAPSAARPQALLVTEAVTATSTDFRFSQEWQGMEELPEAGTVIAYSNGEPVVTPYDRCVLIMPSGQAAQPGLTMVRLARPLN